MREVKVQTGTGEEGSWKERNGERREGRRMEEAAMDITTSCDGYHNIHTRHEADQQELKRLDQLQVQRRGQVYAEGQE